MPRSSVASTSTGPDDVRAARRGRAPRATTRRAGAPTGRTRESPIESTRPRTTRAYEGQATITIASTALRSPRPSDAVTTIARMIAGNAKTRSVDAHHDAVRRARGSSRRSRRAMPPIMAASATSSSASGIEMPRAVDHAAEHVAAELVGAERGGRRDGGCERRERPARAGRTARSAARRPRRAATPIAITAPTIASGCRQARPHAGRGRRTADGSGRRRPRSRDPDPRVDHPVEHVDDEVDRRCRRRATNRLDARDRGHVERRSALVVGVLADPGPGEDRSRRARRR